MKKRISVLLVLTLLVATMLIGCSSNGVSGTYTLVKMDSDGMVLEGEFIEAMGLTIEFKSGDTVVAEVAGETSTGTYKVNGNKLTYTMEGDTMTGTIDGNFIEFKDDTVIMTFEKK